jgi:hypothetical protein
MQAIVDAVPIVLQCPAATRAAALGIDKLRFADGAGPQCVVHRPQVGARPDEFTPEPAAQHRASGDNDCRKVTARRAHQGGWRGLVTPAEEHDPVDRVRPDRLLDVHAHEVAQKHARRADQWLAEGRHRKLDRKAPGLIDASLHCLGENPKVAVAWRQIRPRVADADHRSPVEHSVWRALVLHPRAVDEPMKIGRLEPVL